MRSFPTAKVEAGRIKAPPFGSPDLVPYGAFHVQGPCGRALEIIASDGTAEIPWEHVSVSTDGKHPPNWQEMCWVKEQFWTDDETVLQFHPRKAEYKNLHPNCLHMWRNIGLNHPLPPQVAV